MTSISNLYKNITTLLNNYFYNRKEKPLKYSEWFTSIYKNGTWYLGIKTIEQEVIDIEKTVIKPSGPHVVGFTITLNKVHSQQEFDTNEYINQSSVIIDENNNQIRFACSFSTVYTYGLTFTLKEYYDEENNELYEGCFWRDE